MSLTSAHVERAFWINMLMLGFDAELENQKHNITLGSEMFRGPNTKGMEVVMHFLLSLLDPKCKEVTDENGFR